MKRLPLPQITNCDSCGACCLGQEALPLDNYQGTPPPALLAEIAAMRERFNRDGWPGNGEPCVWYDAETRRCKHYEHRPDVCRDTVKPGDDDCRRIRRKAGVDATARFTFKGGRLVRA